VACSRDGTHVQTRPMSKHQSYCPNRNSLAAIPQRHPFRNASRPRKFDEVWWERFGMWTGKMHNTAITKEDAPVLLQQSGGDHK
jgi:hypothetical protein